MREIKFRAYTKDHWIGKDMVYDYQDTIYVGSVGWGDFPIMQFTGLKDKNGVYIYEGDIITYKRSIGNWTGQFIITNHKIIFSEEVFAFVMEYGNSYIKLRKHWGYEYEVIGNIYENPELKC